jgi:hypothetical protein
VVQRKQHQQRFIQYCIFLRTVRTTWCTAIKEIKKTSETFDPVALLDTSLVNTRINEQNLLDCTQRSVLQLSTDSVISLCHEMLPAPGSMQGLWYALAHSARALLLQSWFYTKGAIRYLSVCIHIKISSWTCSIGGFPPQPVVREMRLNSRLPCISVPFLATFAQWRQVPTSIGPSVRIHQCGSKWTDLTWSLVTSGQKYRAFYVKA